MAVLALTKEIIRLEATRMTCDFTQRLLRKIFQNKSELRFQTRCDSSGNFPAATLA